MFKNVSAGLSLTLLAIVAQHGYVQAAPKGWECRYSLYEPFDRRRSRSDYSCYGTSLPETRQRMKARCRALDFYDCLAGPCFPLEYAPGKSCER